MLPSKPMSGVKVCNLGFDGNFQVMIEISINIGIYWYVKTSSKYILNITQISVRGNY